MLDSAENKERNQCKKSFTDILPVKIYFICFVLIFNRNQAALLTSGLLILHPPNLVHDPPMLNRAEVRSDKGIFTEISPWITEITKT